VQVWILNFNFSLCYALRTEGSVTPIFRPSERKLQLNLVSRGSFFSRCALRASAEDGFCLNFWIL